MIPVLETERLILRGHSLDDFNDSASMWADPEVVKHISGVPSSIEASWTRLLKYAGHWALLGFGYWMIEEKRNRHFIGEVGFADFKRNVTPAFDGAPETGWVLKPDKQGQGFATEAVAGSLEWADTVRGFDRTVCMVNPDHKASLRVAQKVGYAHPLTASYNEKPVLILSRSRRD